MEKFTPINLHQWSHDMEQVRKGILLTYDMFLRSVYIVKKEIPYIEAERKALESLDNVDKYTQGYAWHYCDHVRNPKTGKLISCKAFLVRS